MPNKAYYDSGAVRVYFNNSSDSFLCDEDDWSQLRRYSWCKSVNGYAVARVQGKTKTFHSLVMCRTPELVIDHISRDKLDNRKGNLRIVPQAVNCINKDTFSKNTSGMIGVYFHKPSGRWRALLSMNGKQISLGYYDDFESAAIARREGERKYFHPILEGGQKCQSQSYTANPVPVKP